jgi:hypothetical protein
MPRLIGAIALVATFALFCQTAGLAQSSSQEEMRSLDEQVQEIKSDVLGIASELSLLEERLEIDGELVAHYIYSFKELEALEKGGVQRVYTGNVATGGHDLTVAVNGKLRNGNDFSSSETFSFNKSIDPQLLGLTLSARGGGAAIQLGNW